MAARIVAEGMSVRATEEAVTLANRADNEIAPPQKRKPIVMPGLQDVAERLSDSFDTRVTVSLGKRKGKIVVEFGSVDDLQRIVGMMEAQNPSRELGCPFGDVIMMTGHTTYFRHCDKSRWSELLEILNRDERC